MSRNLNHVSLCVEIRGYVLVCNPAVAYIASLIAYVCSNAGMLLTTGPMKYTTIFFILSGVKRLSGNELNSVGDRHLAPFSL